MAAARSARQLEHLEAIGSVHELHQVSSILQTQPEPEGQTAGAHTGPLKEQRQDAGRSGAQPRLSGYQTSVVETLFMEPCAADRPGDVGAGGERPLTDDAIMPVCPNLGDCCGTPPI